MAWPTQQNAQLNARDRVFAALDKAKERHIVFTEVDLRISEGSSYGLYSMTGQNLSAEIVTQALQNLVQNFQPTTPVIMSFRAQFQSGQDLKDFAQTFDFNYAGQWKTT